MFKAFNDFCHILWSPFESESDLFIRRAFAAGLLDSPDQAQGKKDVMICPDLVDKKSRWSKIKSEKWTQFRRKKSKK